MNMTDEQIDTAIAALQAMKAKREPAEHWLVLNSKGNIYLRCDDEATAQNHFAEMQAGGQFKPYTLHHMREVIA